MGRNDSFKSVLEIPQKNGPSGKKALNKINFKPVSRLLYSRQVGVVIIYLVVTLLSQSKLPTHFYAR